MSAFLPFFTPSCTRYTFSGHSTLSIWLSVDPMADKYPGVSPYVYCGNNPVRLVDADGRDYEVVFDHEKKTITSGGI